MLYKRQIKTAKIKSGYIPPYALTQTRQAGTRKYSNGKASSETRLSVSMSNLVRIRSILAKLALVN